MPFASSCVLGPVHPLLIMAGPPAPGSSTLRRYCQPLPLPAGRLRPAIVSAVFALSGFLVAGSAEKSVDCADFIANPRFAIVPALAVEIVLCALLLGPLVTPVPFRPTSPRSVLIAFSQCVSAGPDDLPASQKQSHSDYVTGSLWTGPHEISVYIVLARALARVLPATHLLLCRGWCCCLPLRIATAAARASKLSFLLASACSPPSCVTRGAARLVPVFFVGCGAVSKKYRYRERIPFHGALAAAAPRSYLGAACGRRARTLHGSVGVMLDGAALHYVIALSASRRTSALRGRRSASSNRPSSRQEAIIRNGIYL